MTAAFNNDGDEVEIRRTRVAMPSPTTTEYSLVNQQEMQDGSLDLAPYKYL
jgi:hypothetical protein